MAGLQWGVPLGCAFPYPFVSLMFFILRIFIVWGKNFNSNFMNLWRFFFNDIKAKILIRNYNSALKSCTSFLRFTLHLPAMHFQFVYLFQFFITKYPSVMLHGISFLRELQVVFLYIGKYYPCWYSRHWGKRRIR